MDWIPSVVATAVARGCHRQRNANAFDRWASSRSRGVWSAHESAPLVRIDPGLLGRKDPPLSGVVFGDGGRRREEEASLLEVPALVSA
jgi:hypothetical protein